MQNQYLYGASAQGIQSFIFQTNKLKEIVGASQLVDRIFTTEFKRFCKRHNHIVSNDNIIISAAGNIKYILDEETLEKIVRFFPKFIANYAPGITISQAAVLISSDLKSDIDNLEKMLKTQRNKASIPVDIGFMGLKRARRTGGVATDSDDFEDRSTLAKIKDREQDTIGLFNRFLQDGATAKEIPFNLSDINKGKENSWIAVVHADGNGLGKLLSNLGKKVKGDNEKAKTAFSQFSKQLEIATTLAAQKAFDTVLDRKMQDLLKKQKVRFPFRPVVLGGDDLTVIIRADLAFDFTEAYLNYFEKTTKEHFKFMKPDYGVDGFEEGLTACAGIAYVKEKYPFHYAVRLAEDLTSATKKIAKDINTNRAPSSLNFYKIQASYLDQLADMKKRTHFAKASSVSFDYGPYFIHTQDGEQPTTKLLREKLEKLRTLESEKKGSTGKLRNWLATLHQDKPTADFLLERIKQVNRKFFDELELEKVLQTTKMNEGDGYKTVANDLIVLNSFLNKKDDE